MSLAIPLSLPLTLPTLPHAHTHTHTGLCTHIPEAHAVIMKTGNWGPLGIQKKHTHTVPTQLSTYNVILNNCSFVNSG